MLSTLIPTRFLNKLYAWSLEGLDFNFDGNGGIECRDHVTLNQRIIETVVGMAFPTLAYVLYYLYFKNSTNTKSQNKSDQALCNYN